MKNKNLKTGVSLIIGGSLCFIGTIVSISAIESNNESSATFGMVCVIFGYVSIIFAGIFHILKK